MTPDEGIMVRMFEYGFGHAIKNVEMPGTGTSPIVMHFPEPLILYLYEEREIPPTDQLIIDFGSQGQFRYQARTVNYLKMSMEELNQKKLIVLIPFQLLRLRREIEKKRTPENMEALKSLIQHDILGLLKRNQAAGNLTVSDTRKLKQMVLQLYHHIYDRYEEMEKAGVTQMVEDALVLDIDVIEYEHKKELEQLAKEKEEEKEREKQALIAKKDREAQALIAEKDREAQELVARLVQNLAKSGQTPEQIAGMAGLELKDVQAILEQKK